MQGETFSVQYWGSHPDADNDDCHSGDDFATLAEAEAVFLAAVTTRFCLRDCTAYVELARNTPDGYVETLKVRPNPDYKPSVDSDDDWKREQAMEAGMLHGVEAYNEVMGW